MKTLVLSLILSCSVANAATYYVDAVDGNDDNDGLSIEEAWKTIVYAEAHADNGSTVYVADGNYGNVTIDRADTGRTGWDDAVTFTPYADASPLFTNLNIAGNANHCLIFDGLSFLYPDGTGLVAAGKTVANVSQGGYVKLTGCEIKGRLGYDRH